MKVILIVLCLLIAISTSSMTHFQKYPDPIIITSIENNIIEECFISNYYYTISLKGYNPNRNHFELIYNKSIELEIDYLLMFALVAEESSFRQFARNKNKDNSNDFGYFQLNDRWHPQFKDDVEAHIDYGINFFKWCLKVEEDNVIRALSRYNSGKPNSILGLAYARRVLSRKREFEDLLYSQTLMR